MKQHNHQKTAWSQVWPISFTQKTTHRQTTRWKMTAASKTKCSTMRTSAEIWWTISIISLWVPTWGMSGVLLLTSSHGTGLSVIPANKATTFRQGSHHARATWLWGLIRGLQSCPWKMAAQISNSRCTMAKTRKMAESRTSKPNNSMWSSCMISLVIPSSQTNRWQSTNSCSRCETPTWWCRLPRNKKQTTWALK